MSQLFRLEIFEPSRSRIERGLLSGFEVTRELARTGGEVVRFAGGGSVRRVGGESADSRGRKVSDAKTGGRLIWGEFCAEVGEDVIEGEESSGLARSGAEAVTISGDWNGNGLFVSALGLRSLFEVSAGEPISIGLDGLTSGRGGGLMSDVRGRGTGGGEPDLSD